MSSAALPNLCPTISCALESPRLRVISNGKGLQSVTMILLASRGMIGPMPDVALDAALADERSSSGENMRWLQSQNMGVPIPFASVYGGDIQGDLEQLVGGWIDRMSNPPFFVRNADGTRGILGRGCTRDYKLRPIWRKLREMLGYGPRAPMPREPIVEMWIGITCDEKHRMAPSVHPWIRNRYPLIEAGWYRHDCDDWVWNEYGVRVKHSGCKHCSYTSDEQWLWMKIHQPADFAAAVAVDRLICRGMPGVEGECFLHDSLTPLDAIDFEDLVAAKRGRLLDWSGCGAGMCGI